MLNKQTLIIVGSNSVHTLRYINTISPYFDTIIFITNNSANLNLPSNTIAYNVNFKLINLKARTQICNIIKKHYKKTTIVHIHQANSYAMHTLMAIKKSKLPIKTILTTWGSDILLLPYKNKLFYRLAKFYLANADIITSDSFYMSYCIKQIQPKVKSVFTINFGVQNLPEMISITNKENIILSNRIHKKLYNIDKIIIAYNNLIKESQYADYKLIIAGDGIENTNLRKLAKKYHLENKIKFTGMLKYEELVNLYMKAKLFISIPSSDSTSLSLLEAMSYGCYPIVSNLPANNEWVINKFNGLICENTEMLDKLIIEAVKTVTNLTEYEKISLFNNSLIKQKASPQNNISQFIDLYKSLI